ncbi:unnamed protein product [Polarella glacialis]|uniref:Ion transport domain-containing protein n=1 Tax=Polarella glacialis TaxID=89957 RepID=A0A813KNZ0_POLGL|nr:unnamed protein product [Polarella glacialis]
MAEAKRGRILLVGAPAGATPGVPGACAFAASMAFVRALADGLRQELADVGVGVSCLDSECLGREFGLDEALASTCVSFLSSSSSSSSNSNNNNYNNNNNNNPRDNNSNNYNSNSNDYSNNNPYNNSNSYSNQRDSQRSSSSREGGDGGRRRNRRLEEQQEGPDPDLAWSGRAWQEAYQQLAVERNFTVLPFGAEIDRLQRSSLAELSNALLVGFAVFIYILERMPGISPSKLNVLHVIDDVPTALFFFDYVARWWSRGLKWDYALTPAMVFDLISVLPFLLRPFVPEFIGVELTFLKLLRVVRIYRFFRPKAFSDIVRVLLPPEEAESLTRMMQEMPPYQLQVVRTFGVVFTLVFITAGLCYEAEHRVNPQFGDIFSSIYFSLIALSTVGFGDIEPVTPAGRVAISICLVIGLCVIPAQASLVAAAVSEEQRRNEDSESVADADALLSSLEQAGAKLAWDAARIAELEDLERQERARIDELEQQATAWVAAKAKELLGLESSQPPGDDDAAAPEGEVDSSLTKVSESSSAENAIR